jgi:hypothetical protein
VNEAFQEAGNADALRRSVNLLRLNQMKEEKRKLNKRFRLNEEHGIPQQPVVYLSQNLKYATV